MSRKVFRYALPITDAPVLPLPESAQVLSVGPPRGERLSLDLWAIVDPDAPLRPRQFVIVGTGNPMPDEPGRFVGTVPTHGGSLIWHVFEVAP